VPTEGREELSKEVYEMLHKIMDKENKSANTMLTGDMNIRIGNNKVTNTVSTNGEAAVKN
jgi:exonuclease III